MSDIKFVDKQESINPITQFGEYLYNRLPKVYRDYDVEIERLNVETQKKETFKTLKEYLYSFALGGFQPLLEDLEAIISLVDPFKCPSEFLPYLLRHFGLDYIDDIPEKFQRRLVQNVVTLYEKKGTIPAVAFLAKELSGFDVKIEEKSDGSIEFALIKLNAYEDEDAELLLAQDVIQRYIHLFLPAQTKSKIIVVYGFTENIHINPNGKSEDTTYDHAYYDVDEYEDITYIDENGYDSKTGGYSEAFDYLKHVVEDDFNALKLKLEEESHTFSPSLPDLTSLTNCVENEGIPMFTNVISCEDTITEQKLTSTTGEVEFNIPASASNISVNKLVGGGDYAVLPIYKCTTDLLKGTTLEFKYDGKSYGYYTLERDLYASDVFPTTFQLDIYNNMVRVYNHYFTEIIDESYDFTLYSGYGSYYTYLRNGSIPYTLDLNYIRIKCDYDKEFKKTNNIYEQPTDTPTIVFGSSNTVYLSLLDVITSPESTKEFVKTYPITIIAPSDNSSYSYSIPCGKTIAYKKLSNTPVSGSTTIECTVYTMNDRKTVFAYESPIFTQNSNIAISGYYGLKTFPESHVISDNIQVTGHLTGVPLIDYKLYGNSYQETRSGKNLLYSNVTTHTINGVTMTYDNGVITLNGTCTTSVNFELGNIALSANTYTLSANANKVPVNNDYAFVQLYDSTNKQIIQIDNSNAQGYQTIITSVDGKFAYRVRIDKGCVYDNVILRPQLELGSTATEYEPYGVMPSPEFPSEIQSVGDLTTKNLINESAITLSSGYWADNTGNQINNNRRFIRISSVKCNPNETYTLSSNLKIYSIWFFNNDTSIRKTYIQNMVATFKTPENCNRLRISLVNTSGNTDTIAFKWIQLEIGSTATEYDPYPKYDIPITVKGKNLFDKSISTNTGIRNETVITDNSYSIGILRNNKICEILKPNTTYTISCEFECESIPSDVTLSMNLLGFSMYTTVSGYSTAGALINKQLSVGEIYYYSQTITTPLKFDSGGDYRFLLYRNAYKGADGKYQFPAIICRNIQIEEGTSSTAYEPYKGSITEHIYLDEPLRKIGDYADYIDYKNKKVVRNTKKVTFDGTENWVKETLSGKEYSNFYIDSNPTAKARKDVLSNIFISNVSVSTGTENNAFISYSTKLNITYATDTVENWKTQLSAWNEEGNPLTVYYILATPTEELIEVPDIITTDTNTMYMYIGTSIQPSSIDITYYENTPVPQLSEVVYDLGIPLVSFDGYSESIEKIDGKYYLRSAIKEIPLEYMYDNLVSGSYGGIELSCVDWFSIRGNSFSESTPYYFNMSPCKSDVDQVPVRGENEDGGFVILPNYWDTFDFLSIFKNAESSNPYGSDCVTIAVNGEFAFWSGERLELIGLESFRRTFNDMFRYSDIPPKFYIYDKYNKYGGETLTEITDKEVINKLNLLPIPEDYAIISSKGIKYSSMDVSVQSKRYY